MKNQGQNDCTKKIMNRFIFIYGNLIFCWWNYKRREKWLILTPLLALKRLSGAIDNLLMLFWIKKKYSIINEIMQAFSRIFYDFSDSNQNLPRNVHFAYYQMQYLCQRKANGYDYAPQVRFAVIYTTGLMVNSCLVTYIIFLLAGLS